MEQLNWVELKSLGAYSGTLVILAWTLRALVMKFADFLSSRDLRANELHLELVRAIYQHSGEMKASRQEVVEEIRSNGHHVIREIKNHMDWRTGHSHSAGFKQRTVQHGGPGPQESQEIASQPTPNNSLPMKTLCVALMGLLLSCAALKAQPLPEPDMVSVAYSETPEAANNLKRFQAEHVEPVVTYLHTISQVIDDASLDLHTAITITNSDPAKRSQLTNDLSAALEELGVPPSCRKLPAVPCFVSWLRSFSPSIRQGVLATTAAQMSRRHDKSIPQPQINLLVAEALFERSKAVPNGPALPSK